LYRETVALRERLAHGDSEQAMHEPAAAYYNLAVFSSDRSVMQKAYMGEREHTDIILFGHTHTAVHEIKSGVHIVSPGALRYARDGGPSYAIIDVNGPDGRVRIRIVTALYRT
jgi:predicted phosphodiesterase